MVSLRRCDVCLGLGIVVSGAGLCEGVPVAAASSRICLTAQYEEWVTSIGGMSPDGGTLVSQRVLGLIGVGSSIVFTLSGTSASCARATVGW